MTEVTIITNNVPRDVVEAYELTPEQRKEFDYLAWDKIEKGEDAASLIQYKGKWYDLGDFQHIGEGVNFLDLKAVWDGYISDSFFSGILLKWVPGTNWEQVIMGRYYT